MQLNEHQEKWLQELESGKHKQCLEKLHNGTGYCCLGIAERFVCNVKPKRIGNFSDGFCYEFNGETAILSGKSNNLIGLRFNDGSINDDFKVKFAEAMKENGFEHFNSSLTGYNDAGATFAQIAAAIRKYPEAVFVTPEPKAV